MALSEGALTTLDTVKAELGIPLLDTSQDARIERMIEAVSAEFAGIAQRKFHYEEDIVELYKGYGDNRLVVLRVPLIEVGSIEIIDFEGNVSYTYDVEQWELDDPAAGIIYSAFYWPFTGINAAGIKQDPIVGTERKSIRVTYTGGYVTPNQATLLLLRTLPFDIEEAVIQSAVAMFSRSSTGASGDIVSETSAGGSSVTYDVGTTSSTFSTSGLLTVDALSVARRYRRGFARSI